MKSELVQEAIRNLRVEDIELKPFNNNLIPPRIIGPECAREIYRDADGVLQSRPYRGNPFEAPQEPQSESALGPKVCKRCGFHSGAKILTAYAPEGVHACMACNCTEYVNQSEAPRFPDNAVDAIHHMAKVRQAA